MSVQLELAALERPWIDAVLPEIRGIVRSVGEFTADDLHEFVETPANVNLWGVLLAKLKNEGAIERVGARASKRAEANGRLVSVWRAVA